MTRDYVEIYADGAKAALRDAIQELGEYIKAEPEKEKQYQAKAIRQQLQALMKQVLEELA